MICDNLLCTIELVEYAYAQAQKDTDEPIGDLIIEGAEHLCYDQPKRQDNAMNEPSTSTPTSAFCGMAHLVSVTNRPVSASC